MSRTYNFPNLQLASGILKITIINDAESDATKASAQITFGIPIDLDFITVGTSDMFTYRDTPTLPDEFHTIEELTALIDALSYVDAIEDGSIITITAAEAGESGNDIVYGGPWNTSLAPFHLTGGLDGHLTDDVEGDWILSDIKKSESIEHQGIGGLMHLADVDVEVYDNNLLFRDEILNPDVMTKAEAILLLEVDSVDYEIIYGDIDLGTKEFPEYYDNSDSDPETVTVAGTCRFTIISMLKRLESKSVADLKTALDSKKLYGKYNYMYGSYNIEGDWVKISDIIDTIVGFLGLPIESTVYDIAQRFGVGAGWQELSDLEIFYEWTNSVVKYIGDWFEEDAPSGASLMQLRDCKAVLEHLSSLFLAYPNLRYNSATEKFHLELIQRTHGSTVSVGKALMEGDTTRTEKAWMGYSALRVSVSQNGLGPANSYYEIYPSNLSQENFEVIEQNFDFVCPIRLHAVDEVQSWRTWNNLVLRGAPPNDNIVVPIERIKDEDGTIYSYRYSKFLIENFINFWTIGRRMYEETVDGIKIDSVNLGNLVFIFNNYYTIVDIERDFVRDTMRLLLVQYPSPAFPQEFTSSATVTPEPTLALLNDQAEWLVNDGGEFIYVE